MPPSPWPFTVSSVFLLVCRLCSLLTDSKCSIFLASSFFCSWCQSQLHCCPHSCSSQFGHQLQNNSPCPFVFIHSFFSPILYTKWLIQTPSLTLVGPCWRIISAIHSISIVSVYIIQTYNLALLYWIIQHIVLCGCSFSVRFNAGHHDGHRLCHRHRSCCGWCSHCCYHWHDTLGHCYINCICFVFVLICQLLFLRASVSPIQCTRPLIVCWAIRSCASCNGPWGASSWFYSAHPLCIKGIFCHPCAPTAEYDVTFCAVGALLWYVTTERALLSSPPHGIGQMVTGLVGPWAGAIHGFATAIALYMSPSAAGLSPPVRANIADWFNSVPHIHPLDPFSDQSVHHPVPISYKDLWQLELATVPSYPTWVRIGNTPEVQS